MSERVPFGETGSVQRKSPPRRTEMPPNGWSSQSSTSCKDLSRYSKYRRSLIGASSHMIIDVGFIKSQSNVFFMSQEVFSVRSIGILNLECAVLPDESSNDVIPEAETARTIFPVDLKYEIIVVHKNVFPVPPFP